jgi:hypothetical protein
MLGAVKVDVATYRAALEAQENDRRTAPAARSCPVRTLVMSFGKDSAGSEDALGHRKGGSRSRTVKKARGWFEHPTPLSRS